MEKICRECTRPLEGNNTIYCGHLCGNRAKSRQFAASMTTAAHELRDTAEVIDDYLVLRMRAGGFVKVDPDDLAFLGDWCWYKSAFGYAVRAIRVDGTASGKSISRMHREIMARHLGRPLGRWELIDHVNGDRLDNRKKNLRLANATQNMHNLKKHGVTSSRYKGVCWDAARKKWKAEIRADERRWMIGRFEDEDTAAWMRDQWCIALHGEFAWLNFDYEVIA